LLPATPYKLFTATFMGQTPKMEPSAVLWRFYPCKNHAKAMHAILIKSNPAF
jgi:hypothetical protein